MRVFEYLILFCFVLSGAIHIIIAPEHYAHAPAHGLFFGAIGLMQMAYAIARWRYPRSYLRMPGFFLSGGVIFLWFLTHLFSVPFASAPHPLDWAAIYSKLFEGTAFLSLLGRDFKGFRQACMPRFALRLLGTIVLSCGAGLILWVGALMLAPSLSFLAEVPEGHDGHHHVHSEPGQASFSSAAPAASDNYAWNLPAGFPFPYVPAENPMSAEKFTLGRYLFYDQRLSANKSMSCASCHVQRLAFTDGKATPHGSTGNILTRNSQGLANVGYYSTLTWANPVLTSLEKQILIPMFGEFPVELGITGHEQEVLERIKNDAGYQRMFVSAYPDQANPITWGNVVKALASFCRGLISSNAPYDRYQVGDSSALSESAQRGMQMFLSEDLECHHCHGGFNFTGSTRQRNTVFVETPFHNTGLYNVDGQGAYPANNTGVAAISNRPEDMGRFRAPSLRNVALTAPYMHDGSIGSLEEVIRFYEAGGRHLSTGPYAGDGRRSPLKSGLVSGFDLTDQERADMIAFLHALTDETFISNPRFSDPFVAGAQP